MFGEKYANSVRVIKFKNSIELCGGTHVLNTSEIGIFKIVSESSIASGIRRIEAVTSVGAINLLNQKYSLLEDVKMLLKGSENIMVTIQKLI